MLVLTRKVQQSILIGDDVELRIISVKGGGKNSTVRIGIIAPPDRKVLRKEVLSEVTEENRLAAASAPMKLEDHRL